MEALEIGAGPAKDEAEATFKLHTGKRKVRAHLQKTFDLVAEGVHSSNWLPGEDSNLQPFG